jgi:hypothetical protein
MLAGSLPAAARADETSTCNGAYEEADSLVRLGGSKLLDARERLRVCARPSCKPWMVKECTKSLSEVDARIPSVVLVAKDTAGREVVDVTVTTEDNTEIARRLDGRAVEIGPGERVFTFVAADGRRATVRAIVKEGEKAQRVTAKLEASKPVVVAPVPVPAPAPAPSTPPAVAHPPAPAPVQPAAVEPASRRPPETERGGSGLRTTGYVVAGVGVAGLLAGTIFGVSAMVQKSDAACVDNACDAGSLASARSSATVSTIGFVVGGALLAGGIALVVLAPSRSPSSSSAARLELAPAVAQREAGMLMRGSW